jgi:polyferredoxin
MLSLHCDCLNSVHETSDKLKQRETLHCLSVITKTQACMSIRAGLPGKTTHSYAKQDKTMGNVTRSRTILTMQTQQCVHFVLTYTFRCQQYNNY